MNQYVLVADEENEEPIELPVEDDGTVLLTTLVAQFAGASGLRYRNPETNTWRGVRLAEGRLFPPEASWSNHTYFTVYPKGF
jgi:TAR DNA-binding protein 43